MKIDGGCHCGALTYEAEIDPDTMTICHCTDCQKMSGTAFRTVIRAHEGDFKMLSGEPKIYVKTAENGTPRAMGFCENCGTQIYGTSVGEIAESEGHHPALTTEWGRVTVDWWTHKIHDIHRNDLIMAARSDALYDAAQ